MDHPAEHLVFVGNLPFKTSSEDLTAFFAVAAPVTEVKIVRRGKRSLGYGFAAFANTADRDNAVAKCHKKELDGREINVEAAKPKSELPEKERRPRAPRARKPRKPKKDDAAEPKQQETEDGVIVSHADGKKKRKPRKKRAPKAAEGGEEAAPKKQTRPKRERRVPTGEPSKTTCFLANLPFSLDNDGLRSVFEGYNVKSATVVVRKITGRSKGFGFLELADEAEQARLLKDVEGGKTFVHSDREIGIKVALSEPPTAEEKAE